jgi:hypothetical protein
MGTYLFRYYRNILVFLLHFLPDFPVTNDRAGWAGQNRAYYVCVLLVPEYRKGKTGSPTFHVGKINDEFTCHYIA